MGSERVPPPRHWEVSRVAVAAFVLIGTASGNETGVLRAVQGAPGVTSANAVTGPYDIIAQVQAHDEKELGTTIMTQIRSITGVTSTLTCVVVG